MLPIFGYLYDILYICISFNNSLLYLLDVICLAIFKILYKKIIITINLSIFYVHILQ